MFEISENFDLDTQDCIEELCKSKKLPVSLLIVKLTRKFRLKLQQSL
jgi:hypothetical protein